MFGYVVRRLVTALLVVILASFLAFTLFFKGPTNPAKSLCEDRGRCTPEKLYALEESMGLHDSLWTNYGRFLGGLVHDRTINVGSAYHCDAPCLGISFHTRTEITKDLKTYYPATLSVALGGATLYLLMGLPIGVIAARYRGSAYDKVTIGTGLVISSIPYYVFALTAWILLTLQTSIFPETGYNPITQGIGPWAAGLLLPWLVLGITSAPTYARFTRGQMLETLGEDYIRTAKAKGLSSQKVMYKHALRVAIVPIITIFGLDLASLLAGTLFTEVIFRINGIGAWTLQSIRGTNDFPVMNATVIILATFIVLGNLIVDLLYAVLDPRVRLV